MGDRAPSPAPPGPQLLCIGGTGQNGATLLSRMLGRLPGFVAVGEIGRLWDKGLLDATDCGCGQPFRECPFWRAVGEAAYGGWERVDGELALRLRRAVERHRRHASLPRALPAMAAPGLSPRYDAAVEGYLELMGSLYRGIQEVSGAHVIVDSMKVPAHVYAMRRLPDVTLRVAHLVRDSRGVAYSSVKQVARQGGTPGGLRGRHPPLRTGARWMWINLSYDLLARLGVPTLVVRYERLVADPRDELARVAAFAGASPRPEDLAFVRDHTVELPPDHLVAGNRMRRQTGPLELRADDAWRGGLSERDRVLVGALTWPLQRRYEARGRAGAKRR